MKSKLLSASLIAQVLMVACTGSETTNKEQSNINDSLLNARQSYANFDEVVIDSLHLSLEIDFTTETLRGSANWKIQPMQGATRVILDTRSLKVEKVLVDQQETEFILTDTHEVYGQGLIIPVNASSRELTVFYETGPEAQALQWLSGTQTASGKPFLYSQSQAILARTWVPCMDVPAVRFTYTAEIKCDTAFLPLMSAVNPVAKNPESRYSFTMPQRIPSYLLALAAGDIAYKACDSISGVYAELPVLEKAWNELADMPAMIKAAEALYGEYRWGRYDVLFLPASFPFGGMENPRLTFATPTILAGDRSLVALVAHELAHSWSGNLVTNRSWNDFWLNEGFTVYFEQRIMEAVYGTDYSEMLVTLGYHDLLGTIEDLGREHPDTRLALQLDGRNPDDGVSDIAYEKGRFFLRHLEQLVGRERFDRFLKTYFAEHAFGTMDTRQFLQYLEDRLLNENPEWKEQANLEEWVYQPGLPAGVKVPQSKAFVEVDSLSGLIQQGDKKAIVACQDWTTHHWLRFLRGLTPQGDTVLLAKLEQHFHFSNANAEIRNLWLVLAVKNDWKSKEPEIREFLTSVGRRKFLTPLYRSMDEAGTFWKEAARSIYREARPLYHSVSVNSMDELLDFHP